MLSYSLFGESSGKQWVRLECWEVDWTVNVTWWIKIRFCWFTIWMTGRLGKVASSRHKEMLHRPNALWFTSTCLNICLHRHNMLFTSRETHCTVQQHQEKWMPLKFKCYMFNLYSTHLWTFELIFALNFYLKNQRNACKSVFFIVT